MKKLLPRQVLIVYNFKTITNKLSNLGKKVELFRKNPPVHHVEYLFIRDLFLAVDFLNLSLDDGPGWGFIFLPQLLEEGHVLPVAGIGQDLVEPMVGPFEGEET